jgi:hypothetical protein
MIIANPIYDVVFKYLMEDPQHDDDLVKKIMNRLTRAVASEEVRTKMRIEDELERMYFKDLRAKDEIIVEKEQIITKKEQVIIEKEQIIETQAREMAELRERTEKTELEMAQLREQMTLFMQQQAKK